MDYGPITSECPVGEFRIVLHVRRLPSLSDMGRTDVEEELIPYDSYIPIFAEALSGEVLYSAKCFSAGKNHWQLDKELAERINEDCANVADIYMLMLRLSAVLREAGIGYMSAEEQLELADKVRKVCE